MAEGEYWDVVYRALADFSDLMAKAAAAKAALESVGKAGTDASNNQQAAEQKLVDVRQKEIDALKQEAAQVRTTGDAYKQYNQQALYGGRSDMQSHLSDMERELQYETLLNRQRWLGFTTPQQAYAWRQNEYNQRLLMNRAEWAGYATADQYISYLQKQTAAWQNQNAAMLQRAALYKQNATAALEYINAVQGANKSLGQVSQGDNLAGVQALNDALTGLPDQVNTDVQLTTSAAMTELAAFMAELNQLPDRVEVVADFNDTAAMAKAAAYFRYLRDHDQVDVRETVTSTTGSSGGGGGSPPGTVTGTAGDDDGPDPAAIAAANALSKALAMQSLAAEQAARSDNSLNKTQADVALSAEQAAASIKDSVSLLHQQADAATNNAAANRYAAAAQSFQAAAARAASTDILSSVAALAQQAASSRSSGDAASYAFAANRMLGDAMGSLASPAAAARKSLDDAAAAADDSGHAAQRSYRWWGFLTKQVTLWAGLFGSTELIGQVAVWHIVMDGLIELFALWIPAIATAAIGLTAWGLAGFQAGEKIAKQMYNVWTVSTALNTSVPPLEKGLNSLAKAVQPQVYELFGDALTVLANKGDSFNKIVQQTGDWLEKWGAKIAVAMTSGGNGMKNFLDTGAKDLALIGQGFDSLGTIIVKFLQATALTHVAEDLAAVGDEILKVAAAIVSLVPTPVLAIVLGLHGLVLWGGLATSVVAKLVLPIVGLLGKFEALNGAAMAVTKTLNGTDEQMLKLAQSSAAVKDVSAVTGNGQQLAMFQRDAAKTGQSLEDLALQTSAGRTQFAKYGADLDEAGKKAVMLGIATGATAEDLELIAGKAGKAATETEGLGSKVGGLLSNLPLLGGLFGKSAEGAAEAGTAIEGTAAESEGLLSKLGGMATKLPLVGGGLAALADIPVVGWAAALAVALGATFTWLALLPDPTQKWINSLNQAVDKANIYQVIGTNVQTLAAATTELSNAQKTGVGNVTELSGAQKGLSDQLSSELDHVGSVSKAYGIDMPAALDLMNKAGVTTNQLFTNQAGVWKDALQQVKGLVMGYEAMGQQLGTIGSDLDVLTVSESSQVKEMGNLNTAWDAWIKTVSGGETSFITVAQAVAKFNTDAKATNATMTGIGANALTLQSDFESSFSGVEQLFDAFRSQQALTGSGNFTKFVKEAVASLIPMAGGSKAAAAQISALAQEAGGPATDNIKTLQKWVGSIHDPLKAMYDDTNKETDAAKNLSKEAQALTDSLQSQLNPALANAEFGADGGQKTLNNFANALVKTGANSKQTQEAGKAVAQELLAVEKNAGQAESTFIGWAESMGLSKDKATALWNQFTDGKAKTEAQSKAVQDLRKQYEQAYSAQGKITQPGEWDDMLASFKNGTFYETTFLSWIPQVQTQVKNMNHWIGDFFTNDIPSWYGQSNRALAKGWGTVYTGFFNDVSHPINNFFTNTLPQWYNNSNKFLAQGWGVVFNGFANEVDAPIERFFTQLIPEWYDQANKGLAQGWGVVWNGFANEIDAPIERFFTNTLPQWYNNTNKALAKGWGTVWNGFANEVDAPIERFFTQLIPGWWSSLTQHASSAWKSVWSAFNTYDIDPIKNFFTVTVPNWWNSLIGHASNAWKTVWKDFGSDVLNPMKGFFTTSIPNWWDGLVGHASSAWRTVWKNFNSDVVGPMGNWFSKTLPNTIEGAFKNSVNWVINNVINKAIGFINDVTHVVGIPRIPTIANLAAGGTPASRIQGSVPGPSDSDNVLAKVMGGEYVIRQPARMALEARHGRGFMDYLNHYDTHSGAGSRGILASQRGHAAGGMVMGPTMGYAGGGGILGDLVGGVEGFLGGAGNILSSGASALEGLVKGGVSALEGLARKGATAVFNGVWDGTISPLLNLVPEGSLPGDVTHYIGAELKQGIDTVLQGKDKAAQKQVTATKVKYSGVAGVTQWEPDVLAVLKMLGLPASDLPTVMAQMLTESGGNPNAINLTDSNAAAGDPSRGLMQVIATTFAAYRNPALSGNIYDPMANIYAGLNYAIHRYGNPGWLSVLGQGHGYAMGGPVMPWASGGKILAFGASASEGYGASSSKYSYDSDLARMGFDVENAGIVGNEVTQSSTKNGQAGAIRFANLLNGVKAAVVWEGNDDIAAGVSPTQVVNGYKDILADAHAKAIPVVGGTLQPSGFTGARENERETLNGWIRQQGHFDEVADFDKALRDPAHPNRMAAWVYNKGQVHENHPGDPGYARVATVAHQALNKALALKLKATTQPTAPIGKTSTPTGGGSTGTGSADSGGNPYTAVWDTTAANVVKDWNAFVPAFLTLFHEKEPSGTKDAIWKAWQADMAIAGKSEPLMARNIATFADPSKVTAGTFNNLLGTTGAQVMNEILQGHSPAPSYWVDEVYPSAQLATSKFPTQLRDAYNKFHTFYLYAQAAKKQQAQWAAWKAPATGTGGGSSAPAPVITPGALGGAINNTGAALVNLAPYATMGGPSTPVSGAGDLGFAAGGPVGMSLNQVASMFTGNLPVGGGLSIPVAMPSAQMGQLRKTQEIPRTMAAAAAQSGNRVGLNVENMTVNNPVPETPSTSITRASNRLAFLAGRGQ